MKLPASGPKVIAHNQMIDKEQTFWILIHKETEGAKMVNTNVGSLVIAFTDENKAKKAIRTTFREYSTYRFEDVTMPILLYLMLHSPKNIAIDGILLNPTKDFLKRRFISNDTVLEHMFLREEMDLQGVEEAFEKGKELLENRKDH